MAGLAAVMTTDNWPFDEPRNVAVITTRRIMGGEHSVDHVVHDEDDGAWQFLNWEAGFEMKEAMLVGLEEVIATDKSLLQISDLAPGWFARRERKGGPWRKAMSDSRDNP